MLAIKKSTITHSYSPVIPNKPIASGILMVWPSFNPGFRSFYSLYPGLQFVSPHPGLSLNQKTMLKTKRPLNREGGKAGRGDRNRRKLSLRLVIKINYRKYRRSKHQKFSTLINRPSIALVEGEIPACSRNGSVVGGFCILLTVQKYGRNS